MKPGELVLYKSSWSRIETAIYLSSFVSSIGYHYAYILHITKSNRKLISCVYKYELNTL
jgi:hypothetical protein